MHRSGTSMVASIVQVLGVDMGEELLPAHPTDNRLGYYEDVNFLHLNEKVLLSAGGDWLEPPSRYRIILAGVRHNDAIKRIVDKKKKMQKWGWKDPRTVLTIELFLPYLTNPHFIVCQRSTESIVKSILKREDTTDARFAEKVTEEYKLRTEDFLNRHSRLPVLRLDYEDILSRPKRNIQRIERFLGVKRDGKREDIAISKVVSTEKHH